MSHYFKFEPVLNQKRESLIKAYYRNTERRNDPCFRPIEDRELGIRDYCDLFVSMGKEGTTLALYGSELSIQADNTGERAAYPMQLFADNAYCYYGIKLNILAHLSGLQTNRLMLYFSENQSREFRKKEITAMVLLDHYRIHHKASPVPVREQTKKLNLFND